MQGCTHSHFGLTCAFKNTAQVHSKSLWAHKGGQKHRENSRKPCAGALRIISGSFARSETLHRCIQSHFGITQAVILLVDMHTFCMGPSKTRVFLLLMHMGPSKTLVFSLVLRIGAYDFVCGVLCSIINIFCMGPSKHTRAFITFVYLWQLFCLWGVALLPNMHLFYMGPSKTMCFQYFCVLVYTFRLWGLALFTNMLIFCMGPSKRLAVSMLSIFMGEFKLKSDVCLLFW